MQFAEIFLREKQFNGNSFTLCSLNGSWSHTFQIADDF
jgi:hypothetical protein